MYKYVTKSDSKKATGFDILKFAKETNLTSLKSDLVDLDNNKLKIVPIHLYKLCNIVEKEVVKMMCLMNWLKKLMLLRLLILLI